MPDPFKGIIFREREQQGIRLAALPVLLCAFFLILAPVELSSGQLVEATVGRIGSYPAGGGYGGDLPILNVELSDGSIRQVQTSWSAVANCLPGRYVSLLQRGRSLRLGLRGCSVRHFT